MSSPSERDLVAPATPGSDLGYCSAGVATPSPILILRPVWSRLSASSCEPSLPPKEEDTVTDANPLLDTTGEQHSTTFSSDEDEASSTLKAPMPISKYSMEYNMNHRMTGYAVIFNHENFIKSPQRHSTDYDAERLEKILTTIGFSVQKYKDLKLRNIKFRIKKLASLDHSECDCVLLVVLSHGKSDGLINPSDDQPYHLDMLMKPFKPDNCPTLAGKPKLFFIQACRGEKLDGGITLVKETQVDGSASYKIPLTADFLVFYSTVEGEILSNTMIRPMHVSYSTNIGYASWRNSKNGSWFVQSLCKVLENQAFAEDLQTLLLMVTQEVALEYESYTPNKRDEHLKKEMPEITSTLLRKVKFQRKQEAPGIQEDKLDSQTESS